MSEPSQEPAGAKSETTDFRTALKALTGRNVTIVNPESCEAGPVCFKIKEGGMQPVKRFIPIQRIKRLSWMKDSVFFHI